MAVTTNMGLILPEVSVTAGPTYATQNNTALTTVDSHDHTDGSGVQIPSAGLGINADVEFNDNAATELTKANFTTQSSALSGTNHAQVISGELHFIDGSGNNVQITEDGALSITSSGGIGGDYSATGASVTFTDATNTYLFRDGSSNESLLQFTDMINSGKQEWMTHAPAAGYVVTDTDNRMVIIVDTSAERTITLPDPTLGRRVVVIKCDGTSETNPITLARNGAENIDGTAADKTLARNLGTWTVISDLTDWWGLEDSFYETAQALDARANPAMTITGSYASATWTATDFTHGTYITRSSNNFVFTKAGIYSCQFLLSQLQSTTGSRPVIDVRLQDTTNTATKAERLDIARSCESGTADNFESVTVPFSFEITDAAANNELQWRSTAVTTNVDGRCFARFEWVGAT